MGMETNEQRETPVAPTPYPRVMVVGNLTIDDVVLPDVGLVGSRQGEKVLDKKIQSPTAQAPRR